MRMRSGMLQSRFIRGAVAASTLVDIPVTQLAQQICLIEFEMIEAIQPKEFLNQAWNKDGKEERAPNVLTYVNWFNKFSRWISTTILREETPELRAVLLNRYIDLGEELRRLSNFNGAIEILSSLHSSPIARLKNSWSILPPAALDRLKKLSLLMDTGGNFNHYRTLLRDHEAPYVPYLGTHFTCSSLSLSLSLSLWRAGRLQ